VSHDSTIRRRRFGALCLLTAIAMLVADETVMKGRLSDVGILAYRLVCLVFTMLAICAAFLDVRALRRATRHEQRTLFENTLQNIPKGKSGKTGDSE
jgi:hypothetical protein